jgi:hypothetical protein
MPRCVRLGDGDDALAICQPSDAVYDCQYSIIAGRFTMRSRTEYRPGEPAPEDGIYETLNIFGSPSGDSVHVPKGQPLPPLPRGHMWRKFEEAEPEPPVA